MAAGLNRSSIQTQLNYAFGGQNRHLTKKPMDYRHFLWAKLPSRADRIMRLPSLLMLPSPRAPRRGRARFAGSSTIPRWYRTGVQATRPSPR
jgi:hypothetical protein